MHGETVHEHKFWEVLCTMGANETCCSAKELSSH